MDLDHLNQLKTFSIVRNVSLKLKCPQGEQTKINNNLKDTCNINTSCTRPISYPHVEIYTVSRHMDTPPSPILTLLSLDMLTQGEVTSSKSTKPLEAEQPSPYITLCTNKQCRVIWQCRVTSPHLYVPKSIKHEPGKCHLRQKTG